MTYEQFKNKYNGEYLDWDGQFSAQCWDLAQYYFTECLGVPAYVVSKNVAENTVTLGSNDDLFTDTVYGKEVNWVSIECPKEPWKVKARVRYNQKEQPATLYPLENNCVKLIFDNPQRAVTSGQAVVFYDGDILLGGGTIFTKQ